MRYTYFIICFLVLSGCHRPIYSVQWLKEQPDVTETVATIDAVWWQDIVVVSANFYHLGVKINTRFNHNQMLTLPPKTRFKAFYLTSNPKETLTIDYTEPVFEGYEIGNTFCLVKSSFRQSEFLAVNIWLFEYDVNVSNKKNESVSFFLEDEVEPSDIRGYWFKTKYAKSYPRFSHLQIDTAYTTPENTTFEIIDLDKKTQRNLDKAASKLNSGGTLYWTTSKIDLSDEAEINQEELNKMNQFLETYELSDIFNNKLDVKVKIVDHRNIDEVLTPVKRNKISHRKVKKE